MTVVGLSALVEHPSLAALEDELYEDVVGAIDLDALYTLEQMLWLELGDRATRGELPALTPRDYDAICALAELLVSRALRRLADHPDRWATSLDPLLPPVPARPFRLDELAPLTASTRPTSPAVLP